jgi:undecaprenyl-diphosphatase
MSAHALGPRSPILRLDLALLITASRHRPRLLVLAMRGLTRLGDTSSYALAALLLCASGPQGRHTAAALGAVGLLASLLAQLLKRLWRRPRPAASIAGFSPLVEMPDRFSFPSGHTAVAVAVGSALCTLGTGCPPSLALGLAAAIGLSRVYLGAHYPLDVLVGAALGAGCGTLTPLVLAVLRG